MKMNYDILWVDDEPSNIETLKDSAIEILEEYGIRANVTIVRARRNESVRISMKKGLENPDLDMIVVDYHMPGMRGDELVDILRNSDYVFLPVIFYSSRNIDEVYEAVRDKRLDGVYITPREDFYEKFQAVTKSLLFKEHSIKQTRGLLMEEVSELDARLKDVFEKGWQKLPNERKEQLVKYVKTIVGQRRKNVEVYEQGIPSSIEDFETIMLKDLGTARFDTMSRWKIVKKILEYNNLDEDSQETFHGLAGERRNGSTPLNSIRNKYAHQTRAELETNHTEKNCIEMRKKIRRQQDNLDLILGKLR